MICPPDVLCRWIPEEERWETMHELARALEREVTVNGSPIHGNSLVAARKQYSYGVKIERMMVLACRKRSA